MSDHIEVRPIPATRQLWRVGVQVSRGLHGHPDWVANHALDENGNVMHDLPHNDKIIMIDRWSIGPAFSACSFCVVTTN